MRTSVCVCVHPLAIKNYSREMKAEYTVFQFLYMALAIDTVNGCGLVTKCVISYYQRILRQRCITRSFIIKGHFTSCIVQTRWKASVLKVGMPYGLRSL